jgi:hypothetical protein
VFEFNLNSLKKIKRKRKNRIRPNSAQPSPVGHACALAPLDRWVPPVNDNPRPYTLAPSLPLPCGANLSAPTAPPRSCPLSLPALRARLVSAMNHSPARSLFLSLAASWGPLDSSVFPADPRSRAPWTRLMSLAHVPHLLFEPRPHLLSLPYLISFTPALSRALSPTPMLVGDPRPSCRPSSPLEATLASVVIAGIISKAEGQLRHTQFPSSLK